MPDGWTIWNVERRTCQGAPAANPIICLALHQVVEEGRKKGGTNQDDEMRMELEHKKVLACVDDAFLLGSALMKNSRAELVNH